MFNRLFSKKRSIVFTWLFSYILMLAVPVLIALVTYNRSNDIIEKEIMRSNEFHLNRVKQHMDSSLKDIDRINMEMALNGRIQDILNAGASMDDVMHYTVYQIMNDLKMYNLVQGSYNNFYIYLNSADMVITPLAIYEGSMFFEEYMKAVNLKYQDIKALFLQKRIGDFVILSGDGKNVKDKKYILYIRSLPITSKSEVTANVAVELNVTKFLEDTKGIGDIDNGVMYIIDKHNRLVAASSNDFQLPGDIKYESMNLQEGVLHQKVKDENFILSYTTSQRAEWKYVFMIPSGTFWEKVEYIRVLTFSGLLVCLLLGGAITLFSLKKNYNPIKMMIKQFEDRSRLAFDKKYNEYQFIQQAINNALNEKQEINCKFLQQNKVLRAGFLASLLKGQEKGVPLQKLLSSYHIDFHSDYFAVVLFYIEEYEDYVHCEEEKTYPAIHFKLAQFIIANVVEEIAGQNNQGWMVEIDGTMACLLNLKTTAPEAWREEILRIVNETGQFISTYYHISCMVAVSGLHETVSGIPIAYSEAVEAMEYKRVLGLDKIVFHEDISKFTEGEYYFPIEKEHQLINLIKTGDYQQSMQLLDEIFRINLENSRLSLQIVRCLMFDMISTMIKTMNSLGSHLQNDFIERSNPLGALLECKTVSQMKQKMFDLLEKVCAMTAGSKKPDFRIRDRVTQFITEHYADPELGITMIADAFAMNPKYISKAYKDQTGEGILDFINNLRIEKAKQLMKENESNLDKLAARVGFTSIRTFMRTFKKIEGVTPGKLKEEFRLDERLQ